MTQEFSPALSLPLLLATDGSPGAQLAQAMVQPIATVMANTVMAAGVMATSDPATPTNDPAPDSTPNDSAEPSSPLHSPTGSSPEPGTETPPNERPDVLIVVTVQPRGAKRRLRAASLLPQGSPKAAPPSPSSPAVADTAAALPAPGDGVAADPAAIATLPTEATPTPPTNPRSPLGLTLEQLTQLIRRDFPADFPLSLQVRYGRPTTEILNCARTSGAGLIAVGHRGTGGVRELLLGSVSTAIARYAPCSVLVARSIPKPAPGNHAAAPALDPASAKLTHVLVAIDGSHASRQALATVKYLRAAGIETVTLLHIQPPLNTNYLVAPFVAHSPSWQLSQSLQAAQREQGEQVLRKAAALLADTDLHVQTRLHVGEAGPSICQIAQAMGADLILLGNDAARRSLLSPLQAMRLPRRNATQNRPILRNTRLSVTDDYVIHYAPCPVLLCRAIATTP